MAITTFDPADTAGLAAWYDRRVAAVARDVPDLPAPNRPRHMTLFSHPRPGQTTLTWRDHAPEEALDALAGLESRLLLDAPTGELVVEPERYDAQRLRDMEATRRAKGDRRFSTAVRHVASGQVVAHTMIALDDGDDVHAWQQIAIVDPADRGHRLGLLVKAANLTQLLRRVPRMRFIDTFNAAANARMIEVNERLGFRPVDQWDTWQIPVQPVG